MQESFPLVTGHPSIDLVNTEVVRWGVRHDLLVTASDCDHWITTMQETGHLMLTQIGDGPCAEALDSLLVLRTFLRDGFEAIAYGGVLEDGWHVHLESLMERAPLAYKMVRGQLLPVPVGGLPDSVLSLIALDALQLLASGDLLQLHHCANPDCVLLFIDATGRRKWCSMKICGNRMKVARHQLQRTNS